MAHKYPDRLYRYTNTITGEQHMFTSNKEIHAFLVPLHLSHVLTYISYNRYRSIRHNEHIIEVDSNTYFEYDGVIYNREEALDKFYSLGVGTEKYKFHRIFTAVPNPSPFTTTPAPTLYRDILLEHEPRSVDFIVYELPSDNEQYDYTASRNLYLRLFGVQFDEALAKSNL